MCECVYSYERARCTFPLKLITITYQSLIFVRCLWYEHNGRCTWCCWCAVFGIIKTMKCIVLLNRSSSFWQREDIFMRSMVGFAEANGNNTTSARAAPDKVISCSSNHSHKTLTSFLFWFRKKISPVDLIQWIKPNIYWNSFSQRIHKHKTIYTYILLTKYVLLFIRSRLIARLLFTRFVCPRSLFFIIIYLHANAVNL